MTKADLEAVSRRTVGVKDAADYLGVNRRTIQRYCDHDLLAYDVLPSGHRRIHRLSAVALKHKISYHADNS